MYIPVKFSTNISKLFFLIYEDNFTLTRTLKFGHFRKTKQHVIVKLEREFIIKKEMHIPHADVRTPTLENLSQ